MQITIKIYIKQPTLERHFCILIKFAN